MDITCNNCEEVMSKYLCDVPSEWRKQIVKVVCSAMVSTENCEKFKDCEALTSLSAFSVDGTEVCISYKDENGVIVERCFDFGDIMNSSLDGVDPNCLMTQEEWDALSHLERIQAIIDYGCDCE